ncbi:MAG: hypothetical protein GVY19_02895 [Bacteroidetes bacterium]|jgi:nitrite reductase/ring-hydroxylating ferredoxin subunit|nr:hypothetical protein [Bacteroidota bacterium]
MADQLFTKIRIVLLFSILFIPGCDKKKCDVIPNVTVDFTINLNTPPFNTLQAPGNSVEVPINHAPYADGFDNNGIVIYRRTNDEFIAFDRTCTFPHQESVAIEKQPDDPTTAKCPECESEFLLPSYGSPLEGSSASCPLKEYNTTYYANRNAVRVVNFR